MTYQNLVNFLRALDTLGFTPQSVTFSKGNDKFIDTAEVKMRDDFGFCISDGEIVVSDLSDTWLLFYSETSQVFPYEQMIFQLSETSCMWRLKNEERWL